MWRGPITPAAREEAPRLAGSRRRNRRPLDNEGFHAWEVRGRLVSIRQHVLNSARPTRPSAEAETPHSRDLR